MKRSIPAEDRVPEPAPHWLFSVGVALTGMAIVLGLLSIGLLLHRLLDPIVHAVLGG